MGDTGLAKASGGWWLGFLCVSVATVATFCNYGDIVSGYRAGRPSSVEMASIERSSIKIRAALLGLLSAGQSGLKKEKANSRS